MTAAWNYRLVALSIVIAIVGSYVALDFVTRMRVPKAKHKTLLFIIGALAMGLAIWTMHFVGMLAMYTNMPVSYDKTLSTFSILAATIGSGIAFSIMRRKSIGFTQLFFGSIAMGVAICTMHYIGMASMRMNAVIYYTPSLFILSIFIAIIASGGALWIAFQLQTESPRALFYQKIGGAVIMGIAISSMHYTGMAAANYVVVSDVSNTLTSSTVGHYTLSDLLVLAGIIFTITLVILSSRADVDFQIVKELNVQVSYLASRYQSLITHAREAIISINQKNLVTLWNPSAEHLFGYSEAEALGKNIADLIVTVGHHPHHDIWMGNILTSEAPSITQIMQVRRRNDEIFLIELSYFQSGVGEQTEYTSIIRDITERAKIESDLKNSEEMRRLMIDSVKDYAIFLLDPNGVITSWNTGAQRINGYTADEIVGKNFSVFYLREALQKKHPQYELKMALRDGEYIEQGYRVRKDGSLYWANVTVTPVYRNDQLIGFSKIVQDITEQKKAKEQLDAIIQELESFSYSVSHDLRAPLRSIDGFSKILLERYSKKLDKEGKHYLERVRKSTQQMGQLIDDLLNLSRLARSELHIEKKIDLTSMAKEIIAELQMQEPKRKVEVEIGEGILALGDKQMLCLVLQNLLENAWKFTSHHEIAHIVFKKTFKAGRTVYYVKDDGAGFDMAYEKKLFGVFQRLHQAEEFEGVGVGLAIVQQIIKRHHGSIWAKGSVEKGATFYFTLGKVGDE